ncbi:MAG: EF-hand domain-containing protein [Candidatus Parabeggiatoa sp.]|nr:EF-hand domain-containing protein [Candidatus Parabeggiatoa sp.]
MKTIVTLSTAIALSLAANVTLAKGCGFGFGAGYASDTDRQEARIDRLMTRFDLNQDGQITLDEVQSQRVAHFQEMDADQNELVSQEEFEAYRTQKREERRQQRLDEAFNAADTDGDGVLSQPEFVAAAPKKPQPPQSDSAEQNDQDAVAETRRGKRPAREQGMGVERQGGMMGAGGQGGMDAGRQGGMMGARGQGGMDAGQQGKGKGRQGKGNHFNRLDNNQDGQISLDELTANIPLFDKFDANNDGVITKEELSQQPTRRRY